VKAAIVLRNCDIVDAGFAAAHQAALIESHCSPHLAESMAVCLSANN